MKKENILYLNQPEQSTHLNMVCFGINKCLHWFYQDRSGSITVLPAKKCCDYLPLSGSYCRKYINPHKEMVTGIIRLKIKNLIPWN